VEKTIRRERDITSEVTDRYHFTLMMEDVYLVRLDQVDKLECLEIYIFGVLGVPPPLSKLYQ
jgi:hypothetical protein